MLQQTSPYNSSSSRQQQLKPAQGMLYQGSWEYAGMDLNRHRSSLTQIAICHTLLRGHCGMSDVEYK